MCLTRDLYCKLWKAFVLKGKKKAKKVDAAPKDTHDEGSSSSQHLDDGNHFNQNYQTSPAAWLNIRLLLNLHFHQFLSMITLTVMMLKQVFLGLLVIRLK